MLFTYTPNEQTETNAEIIKECLPPQSVVGDTYMHLHQVEDITNFSFTTSWCRELTIDRVSALVKNLPPGQLNIYGIRKHGDAWASQPYDISGMILRGDRKTNRLFHNLFQFVTETLSYVFETNITELHDTRFWVYTFMVGIQEKVRPFHSMTCLLNRDLDLIPNTPLWKTDDMYGTMFNIPSEWSKSSAVMSYLLYLPRIWGAFYDKDAVLSKLTGCSKLKYNTANISTLCGYSPIRSMDSADDSIQLWRSLARRLMLPLWFTNQGQEDFWVFTYLLIREGMAAKHGLPRIPGLLEALKMECCSGFASWLRRYKSGRNTEAPNWVQKLYSELHDNGPLSLLQFKPVVQYV